MQKLQSKTLDLVSDNINQLRELFPEAFKEGKIDFDALRRVLGDEVETEDERYSFTWHGKGDAIKLAMKQSTGTLQPCKEESKDWDTTQNLFIEGDNLEVLRILQSSYRDKVKMIYIDPPYNTGQDFIYKDDFKDPIKNYKEKVGESSKANPETAGRFHTNWLNMMYPRLKLARSLLKDDGVIFISIDEREFQNLLKICMEIFGEDNFIGTIAWKNCTDNNPTNIAMEHEYIIAYARNKDLIKKEWKSSVSEIKQILIDKFTELSNSSNSLQDMQERYSKWFKMNKAELSPLDGYKNIDEGGIYAGIRGVHNPGKDGYRYDVIHPETGKPCKQPLMGYRFPQSTMNKLLQERKIIFGEDETKIIEIKAYAQDYQEKLSSVFELDNRSGAYDIRKLFPESKSLFQNPKPLKLLKEIFSLVTNDDEIILDFFAGSSAAAHAVMELNVEDDSNRRFIMVQLPEKCSSESEACKTGYETIAEISKERIRRAGEKVKVESQSAQGDLFNQEASCELDIGFRVFKLEKTNFTQWDEEMSDEDASLLKSVQSLKPNCTQEDALYEILLKYGVDISLPIEAKEVLGKKIFSLADNYLLVCLEKNLGLDVIEGIAKLKPTRVVFYDDGFKDDSVKLNAEQTLKKFGVEDIRVI